MSRGGSDWVRRCPWPAAAAHSSASASVHVGDCGLLEPRGCSIDDTTSSTVQKKKETVVVNSRQFPYKSQPAAVHLTFIDAVCFPTRNGNL